MFRYESLSGNSRGLMFALGGFLGGTIVPMKIFFDSTALLTFFVDNYMKSLCWLVLLIKPYKSEPFLLNMKLG